MNIFFRKALTVYNICCHLLRTKSVITNPFRCARLFMERTPDSYESLLRYGNLRFTARKQDMNAVEEVLVEGGYDAMIPFLKSIGPAPVVLDCGANIGSFGLRVLAVRPDAHIVSVEAAADTYAVLKVNQEQSGGNWRAIHAALWKSDGEITLSRSASSVMHTVQEVTAESSEAIPARSLRSLKHEFGLTKVDILKMDIEGAETTVIPSAPEEIQAEMMIIEVHKSLNDPVECCAILAQHYPYAYIGANEKQDKSFPNVVYYLTKEKAVGSGLISVNLMEHLHQVYDPALWKK